MSNDITEILNRKLAEPETRKAVESLVDNIGTISRSVEWVRTLEETGMAESLQGLVYLVANLRGVQMKCRQEAQLLRQQPADQISWIISQGGNSG